MRVMAATLILLVSAVLQLAGCIPVPLFPGGEIYSTENDINNLVDRNASKYEVISTLGIPIKYREATLSYEACQKNAGVGYIFCLPYQCTGDLSRSTTCFNLILRFDYNNILLGYEKEPWSGDVDYDKEDKILQEFASQGDTLAQKVWQQHVRSKREIVFGNAPRQVHALALEGDPEAQMQLYWNDPSDSDALLWLCRAADQDNIEARYRLGLLYENGSEGVPKNMAKAYMWYQIAASTGSAIRSADQARRIREGLSVGQAARADTLVRDWKPGQCERDLAGEILDRNE